MASRQDELRIEFERVEEDLEVEAILKNIKTDFGLDQGVTASGEQLKDEHFLFMLSVCGDIVSQGYCESRDIYL